MNSAWQIVFIAVGGAVGALARYGIYFWIHQGETLWFPFGTLAANAIGCFFAGFILASGGTEKYESVRLLIGVGFLGALTTFSTFSIETVNQIRLNQFSLAMANVLANLIVGLGGVVLGAMLGRWVSSTN
jgi:fluoride exporter